MKKNIKKAAAIVPATLLLAMAMPTSASAVSGHVQDFENDSADWLVSQGSDPALTRLAASDGNHYLQMSAVGAFTRFGGYGNEWDGAWSTSTDVYLDPEWETGTGFDYSVAANGSDGKHQRDFIVHVAKDETTDKLLVASSSNSDFTVRTDLEGRHNAEITEAGWYTMKHSFSEENGHLGVDVELLDAKGAVVFHQHTASTGDPMSEVGGNRYGQFFAVHGDIAIDNVRVDRVDNEAGSSYATDFSGVGITKEATDRWHMSGNYDAAIVKQGSDAHLRISNATAGGGTFGDMLYSPELTVAATETATNNVFNASFVIDPTEYQPGLQMQVGPNTGVDVRDGVLLLTHEKGGLTVQASTYRVDAQGRPVLDDKGEPMFDWVTVAEELPVGEAHTVSTQVVKWADKSPGSANDVFRVSVDGGKTVETTTFEPYYIAMGKPDSAPDALLFRLKDAAGSAVAGKGFLIDDVTMSVTTEAPPVKPTPPTTKPPVKPTPKPVAKPKAKVTAKATPKKNKMHVNVNPNQGKGYWEFKIQKLTKDGWKTLPGTYKTHGKYETRTINLSKGTYRTVVLPDHGHVAGVSNAVHLKK